MSATLRRKKLREDEALILIAEIAPDCLRDEGGRLRNLTGWADEVVRRVNLHGEWIYGVAPQFLPIYLDAFHAELREKGVL